MARPALDVACGNGSLTLAAARRSARATGVDIVPELVADRRRWADVQGFEVDLREGAAEQLDFPDANFDFVVSQLGVMFATNQQQAAAELLRVCRAGGVIGVANWTPESLAGKLFRLGVSARPAAPPKGKPALSTTFRRS